MSLIFHIATAADWAKAQQTGTYTTSTLGRTLAQEGFIHASRREQVRGTLHRFYGGITEPLVLLAIDPAGLDVREEAPDPKQPRTRYPHIYQALPVSAVKDVIKLKGNTLPGATQVWVGESMRRMGMAIFVMLMAVGGARLGAARLAEWGGLLGALLGAVVGIVLLRLVVLRRPRP